LSNSRAAEPGFAGLINGNLYVHHKSDETNPPTLALRDSQENLI